MLKIFSFFLLLVGFFGGCDEDSEPPAVARGRVHYETYCALCHGGKGEGYLSPKANALNNPDFLRSASDPFLYTAVTQGRPGTKMSPFGQDFAGPLSDSMVKDLIAFMRYWDKSPPQTLSDDPVAGDVEQGASLYEQHCVLCHGANAEGKTAMSLNNPVFLASASDGFLEYGIRKGRRATPMLAYETVLSSEEIGHLVAFLRSLERPVDYEPPRGNSEECSELKIFGSQSNGAPPWQVEGPLHESNLSVFNAYDEGREMVLLDARPKGDYLWGHIDGAMSMPYYDVEKCYSALPRDTWIVTYCACPHNESEHAANVLKEQGFDKVRVLNEGYIEWKEAGYPVTEPDSSEDSGGD